MGAIRHMEATMIATLCSHFLMRVARKYFTAERQSFEASKGNAHPASNAFLPDRPGTFFTLATVTNPNAATPGTPAFRSTDGPHTHAPDGMPCSGESRPPASDPSASSRKQRSLITQLPMHQKLRKSLHIISIFSLYFLLYQRLKIAMAEICLTHCAR